MSRKFICFSFFIICVTDFVDCQNSNPPQIEVSQVSRTDYTENLIEYTNGVVELTAEHFDLQIQNSEDRSHFVYLTCSSSEPIEWVFDGPVYNSVHDFDEYYERIDYWDNDPSGDTEIFRSRFAIVVPVPENTGTYTCRHFRSTSISTSLYVFMNTDLKPIFFQPGDHHLLTTNPYYTNHTIFYIPAGQEAEEVLLPLYSNQPKLPFLKVYANNVLLTIGENLSYDSREGLRINLGSDEIDDPFATTFDVHATEDDDFMFNFHLRRNFIVTPNSPRVNQAETNSIQFNCTAQDKIQLVFEPIPEIEPTVTCEDDDLSCVVNVIPSEYAYRTSLTCHLAEEEEAESPLTPILHTWLFTSAEEPMATVQLNKEDTAVTCCTKDHYKPFVQITSDCYTFSECNLRRTELERHDYTQSSEYGIEEKYDNKEECVEQIIPFGFTHETVTVSCSVGPEAFTFAQYSKYDHDIVEVKQTDVYRDSLRALVLGDDGSYYEPDETIVGEINDVIQVGCAADRFYFGTPKLFIDYSDRDSKQIFVPCRGQAKYGLNWHFCNGMVQLPDDKVEGISCRAGNLNSKEMWISRTIAVSVTAGASSIFIRSSSVVIVFLATYILDCKFLV